MINGLFKMGETRAALQIFRKIKGKLVKTDTVMHNTIIVGSLRYLCHTRPDIAYGVGLINMYIVKPTTSHLVEAKRILRYVKGTSSYGIQYSKTQSDELVGYSDSDWSGDKDDRKSIVAYVFMIGNAAFSRSSKKESVVALSSCEA